MVVISIHALREEGDCTSRSAVGLSCQFLSTPSVRRATSSLAFTRPAVSFLSTPSVRRATTRREIVVENSAISIHALREEGDLTTQELQPTAEMISIHALREEGDSVTGWQNGAIPNFYPRPP